MLDLSCPGCGRVLRLHAEAIARECQCPACSAVFTVPPDRGRPLRVERVDARVDAEDLDFEQASAVEEPPPELSEELEEEDDSFAPNADDVDRTRRPKPVRVDDHPAFEEVSTRHIHRASRAGALAFIVVGVLCLLSAWITPHLGGKVQVCDVFGLALFCGLVGAICAASLTVLAHHLGPVRVGTAALLLWTLTVGFIVWKFGEKMEPSGMPMSLFFIGMVGVAGVIFSVIAVVFITLVWRLFRGEPRGTDPDD